MNFFFIIHVKTLMMTMMMIMMTTLGQCASVHAQIHRTCVLHRLSCAVNDHCGAPGWRHRLSAVFTGRCVTLVITTVPKMSVYNVVTVIQLIANDTTADKDSYRHYISS